MAAIGNIQLKGDTVLWVVAGALALFSILAVYSSVGSLALKRPDGNASFFLLKHAMMLALGFVAMFVVHKMKFKFFSQIAIPGIVLSIILLALTLVLGANINNANRWLVIPIINQNFQTSDLAKIFLVLFLGRFLSKNRDQLHDFWKSTMVMLGVVLAVVMLIFPANFSTAALIFICSVVIMFVGGVPFKHLASVGGIAIAALALLVMINQKVPGFLPRLETWQNRVMDFKSGDSDGNYQVELAQFAIASGGLLPKGPGNGSSRNFLPHPYSDMIYAFIVEEWGAILGGILPVLLYLVLLFRGMKINQNSPNRFGQIVGFGLAFMMVFQAFVNMAVSVNLVPVTGQPLPLVSLGGTSTIFTCISFGILISISKSIKKA